LLVAGLDIEFEAFAWWFRRIAVVYLAGKGPGPGRIVRKRVLADLIIDTLLLKPLDSASASRSMRPARFPPLKENPASAKE
jgi:hypothetical protein